MSHYVMSDIHGNRERFTSVMRQIKLRPEDTLYVLGDVIDRFPDGLRILRRLLAMPNVKMLLGNHEFMMLDALDYYADKPLNRWGETRYLRLWYENGGYTTHQSWKHLRKATRAEILRYLNALPLNLAVTVDGREYLLVHGGVDGGARTHKEQEAVVWERIDDDTALPPDKTVIFGHTPTLCYQDAVPAEIWQGEQRIGIDCGCATPARGRLACLRLEDGRVFYSKE